MSDSNAVANGTSRLKGTIRDEGIMYGGLMLQCGTKWGSSSEVEH